LAEKNKPGVVGQEQALDIEHLKKRLDMLDERLDNIDSTVTAVVERVVNQPITINITCPNCGKNVEIALLGRQKPVK